MMKYFFLHKTLRVGLDESDNVYKKLRETLIKRKERGYQVFRKVKDNINKGKDTRAIMSIQN